LQGFSAHIGYLYAERPFRDRLIAARDAGFRAVEHPNPYSVPAADLAAWIDESGLSFVQLALPSGDAARGEKGMAALPGRRDEFRESVHVGIAYARRIGCLAVHAMAGIRPGDVAEADLLAMYVANMREAADAARSAGLTLLIEPIGAATIADYFMSDAQAAVEAIGLIERDNVGLLFDVFHETNAGKDAAAFVRANGGLIHHVHIADHPGRHEPGSGRIDYTPVYDSLNAAAYRGFIGCEYIPAGSTEEGQGWLASHTQRLKLLQERC
jgi:hydroxypyruvate isomerase